MTKSFIVIILSMAGVFSLKRWQGILMDLFSLFQLCSGKLKTLVHAKDAFVLAGKRIAEGILKQAA